MDSGRVLLGLLLAALAVAGDVKTPPGMQPAPDPGTRVYADWTPFAPADGGAAKTALRDSVKVQRGATAWTELPRETTPHTSQFFGARGIVDAGDAKLVVDLLKAEEFQSDLDSVDNAATFQFWLFAHNRPHLAPSAARAAVSGILTERVLKQRVLPLVHELYPNDGLVPCFSFIRRYRETERTRHPTHFDVQSHTTFVASLNEHGVDYDGGLYVATGDKPEDRHYIDLKTGDGAVHQSDLLHGVHVPRGERWSWIVWFSPGSCSSEPTDWHRELAGPESVVEPVNGPTPGDAIHQFLLARRLHAKYASSEPERARQGLEKWLRRSANNGFTRAQNELGELLRSEAMSDAEYAEAKVWLQRAAPTEPAARHNLGLWYLDGGDEYNAIISFEQACEQGSPDACYNVAVSLHHGKAETPRDVPRALQILRRTDTPDALWFAFQISGETADLQRAATLGSPDAQLEAGERALKRGALRDAAALLHRAAVNGHEPAQQRLVELQREVAAKREQQQQQRGEL